MGLWICSCLFLVLLAVQQQVLGQSICQNMQPSPKLEKFVDPLPLPASINLSPKTKLTIGTYKISQKLHRDLPPTTLYAYGTSQATATYPGPTLVARRGVPTKIRWENHIEDESHILPVDKTINWANPKQGGVPITTHVHGLEAASTSDGHPNSWFTAKGEKGPTFITQDNEYPNSQYPAMLWYHDHAMGMTRLNVYAGLCGAYVLQWPEAEKKFRLPSGEFEVPLVIQDKQFYSDGSLNYPSVGSAPQTHPSWCPEFLGDTILVNGKIWPYLNVQARRYRLRLLNGANARFFTLSFSSSALSFLKIGTDGGYLPYPTNLTSITMAPAERVDTIVDFSLVPPGTDVLLLNSAASPFPSGAPPSDGTQYIMKFHVSRAKGNTPIVFPPIFKSNFLSTPFIRWRNFTLQEVVNEEDQVLQTTIDGKAFTDPVTELPRKNTAELWEIINLTPDAHPMHMHLVQFQMLNQQGVDVVKFNAGTCSMLVPYPDPGSCFTGQAVGPDENQVGWKDTIVAWPDRVTRLLIRFSSQDGAVFQFDPTQGPGYVWHCHIVDHEDNDMMRPYLVVP